MNKEEYLKLIEKIFNEQLNESYDEIEDHHYEMIITSASELKERRHKNTIIDLNKFKKPDWNSLIDQYNNFIIDNFSIKITLRKRMVLNHETYEMCLYETVTQSNKYQTIKKINVNKDSRFMNRNWRVKFDNKNKGTGLNKNEVLEIFHWIRAISKLTAFI